MKLSSVLTILILAVILVGGLIVLSVAQATPNMIAAAPDLIALANTESPMDQIMMSRTTAAVNSHSKNISSAYYLLLCLAGTGMIALLLYVFTGASKRVSGLIRELRLMFNGGGGRKPNNVQPTPTQQTPAAGDGYEDHPVVNGFLAPPTTRRTSRTRSPEMYDY